MTAAGPERSVFSRPSAAPLKPVTIVLFGAAGDLATRKLLPGLFHLEVAGLLPDEWRLVASSNRELSDDEFRAVAKRAIDEFGRYGSEGEAWDRFAERLRYVGGGFGPDATDEVARLRSQTQRKSSARRTGSSSAPFLRASSLPSWSVSARPGWQGTLA